MQEGFPGTELNPGRSDEDKDDRLNRRTAAAGKNSS